jgi:hypothetical protein
MKIYYPHIHIGSWNFHGLLECVEDSSFYDILNKFHVFACLETWVSQSRLEEIKNIDDFVFYSHPDQKYNEVIKRG